MARGRPKKSEAEKKTKVKTVAEPSSDAEDDVVEISDDDKEEEEEREEKITKTTRKNKEEVPAEPLPVSSKYAKKIIFAHNGIVKTGWDNMQEVLIPHPRTGQKALFLMDSRPKEKDDEVPFIFEVLTMEEETRSWFLDDSVVSDGNIYLCTPVDPLFLVLPYFMKNAKGMPLKDHLIEFIKDPKTLDIFTTYLTRNSQLTNITKKIVHDDIIAYKIIEDKTLEWLAEKVESTTTYLTEKNLSSSESSVSSNFTKASSENKEKFLHYAGEIVGEYLTDELKKKLFEKLNIPLVQEKKRKSEAALSPHGGSKKLKASNDNNGDSIQPNEDYGSSTPIALNAGSKVTAKEKELQKAAKGTKSLLSFFAPKAK